MTNEYDVENAIKDCDIVINLVGQKPLVKHDINYEEPNIEIPRTIAKVCARKMKESKVKRFFHFSACGASPDGISRRLRTKWQGEQEVLKYFPEATIIRPTTIYSDRNTDNFLGYYLHCWHNNNGTMFLIDDGKSLRQPVQDLDIGVGLHNMLQLDTRGQIYELGGSNTYSIKELLEFYGNVVTQTQVYFN